MKTISLIILLFACVNSFGHDTTRYSFLVVESINNELKVAHIASIDSVQAISDVYGVDAKAVLKNNNYFEFKNNWDYLYVERKRVIRKNGKIKYRKL